MSPRSSIRLLQIVIGVVLCWYGAQLAISQLRAPRHNHVFVFLLLLGALEAIGAVWFLFSTRGGGLTLLSCIATAALFHFLHGQTDGLGMLAIYAAAVITVMSNSAS